MKFTGDSLRPEKEFRFTNEPAHMAAQFGPVAALKRATISGEIRNVTACLGLPAFADLVRRFDGLRRLPVASRSTRSLPFPERGVHADVAAQTSGVHADAPTTLVLPRDLVLERRREPRVTRREARSCSDTAGTGSGWARAVVVEQTRDAVSAGRGDGRPS